jgi:glutamine amidotransferase
MIGVVDYGIGNLTSAKKSLDYLGVASKLIEFEEDFKDVDGIILPGVGAFGPTMNALDDKGLIGPMLDFIRTGRPYLGICVGMQVLFDSSQESPSVSGLGLIKGNVSELTNVTRLPQMQWNKVIPNVGFESDRLLVNLGDEFWMYFLHSYSVHPQDTSVVGATCEYGGKIVSYINKDNIFAAQFHPEKSSAAGLKFISNFVDLCKTGDF